MRNIVYILQIVVSLILIFLILLQKRGTALSSGQFYPLRRGLERRIFQLTIIFIVLFLGLALANLALK